MYQVRKFFRWSLFFVFLLCLFLGTVTGLVAAWSPAGWYEVLGRIGWTLTAIGIPSLIVAVALAMIDS